MLQPSSSASGEPVKGGGDAFFVAIHGRGVRVRAKVTDNSDGTHDVRYLCTESGTYWINISLYGEGLPGSPFMINAGTPTPLAQFCVVSGGSLHQAIARQQQHFEIQFRDAHGNVTHAEDVDVYVELVSVPSPPSSPEKESPLSPSKLLEKGLNFMEGLVGMDLNGDGTIGGKPSSPTASKGGSPAGSKESSKHAGEKWLKMDQAQTEQAPPSLCAPWCQ